MSLPKEFYLQDTKTVARQLLGCVLHRRFEDGRLFSARIAETEAYLGTKDPASHSFKGESARNRAMFLAGGHFYVYLIYGMYFCLNVVTKEAARGEAVLVRALQPLDGRVDKNLMGPGRLCRALEIDKKLDGSSCMGSKLWLERGPPVKKIIRATRVGLNERLGECTEWKLRYHLPGLSTRIERKSSKR